MTTWVGHWRLWVTIGLIDYTCRVLGGLDKVTLDSGASNVSRYHLLFRVVLQGTFTSSLCYVRLIVATHITDKYVIA